MMKEIQMMKCLIINVHANINDLIPGYILSWYHTLLMNIYSLTVNDVITSIT